ncbi:ABC transporter ATP-binding protein [Blastochloris viridis]|uniref:Branched-chain amino acid transport ATP-binding protein LivF n=1 Tax=Blastochloris viridis TaxID=1079 RepID=A0A0H5BHM6_BLAVI|nr:ABC transporter ATP-binding protein [Blastochloris viridis]ALK09454.1 High-affinity branched-chain amino acid transport ATP-binding protein LivF [Blastochloris viridis]BAS00665.1 branched-chain amino acid transport ATP-binding protein LivF [Blastochloris viridis]CUU42117.1 LIV-I protein F [Blastochloris viridis]
MTAPLLDIAGASISYGKVQAVRGVSLTVACGEIVTVIGANGAGKSTLLNAAIGALAADGAIRFMGEDITRLDVEDRVARGLLLVPERRELFSTMTVEDNLVLGGFRVPRGIARDTIAEVYDRFPRLKERRDQLAGTMSGGERQMLAIGRALMSRPKLLMLDEPSLGLAPRIVADIFRIIADLRSTGVSILLVEQNARAALAAADRAHVMELGEVSVSGPAAELARDDRIIQSYLGFH